MPSAGRAAATGPAADCARRGRMPIPLRRAGDRVEVDRHIESLRETVGRLQESQRLAGLGHWSYHHLRGTGLWSDECLRIVGSAPGSDGMSYRALRRRIHPDDRLLLKDRVEAALRDYKRFDIDIRLFGLDGALRWISLIGQPLHDERGRPARMHGAVTDITQRKRSEVRQTMEHAVTHLLSEAAAAAVSAATSAAAPAAAPDAVLADIIETVSGAIGWSGGAAWLLRDPGHPQRAAASWAIADSGCEGYLRQHAESGNGTMAGRVLRRIRQSAGPLWVPDLFHDADTRSDLAARNAGLHALMAFPIERRGEFIGAIVLFAPHRQPADTDLLASLQCIGRHIGDFFHREQIRAALRESEAHFRAVVEQASDSVVVHDEEGRILDVNRRCCVSLGYSHEELLGMRLFDIDPDMTPDRLASLLDTVWSGTPVAVDSRHRARDGTIFPVELRIGPIDVQGRRHLLSLARDMTERTQHHGHIASLDCPDATTGLPDRAMFRRTLEHALRRTEDSRSTLALLFIDLDRFRNINDTLGHDAGDRLLQEMARRLQGLLQGQALVARLGGDEFVVLLESQNADLRPEQVAHSILDTLVREHRLEQQSLHVTASIGISVFPADGSDACSLMKHADAALYRAKSAGRNTFRFHRQGAEGYTAAQLALESGLRHGIERGELVLHYQPTVSIVTGRIRGVEVLVRWQHPDLGLLPPQEFIGLAEETGLIVPLTRWVLREACRQHAAWRAEGLAGVRMAVNLSAREFATAELVSDVEDILRDATMPASLLEVEITESMMMENPARGAAILTRLKALGIRVALDDFGVGFSSLSHLKLFPVDVLKIDQSFLAGVPGTDADEAITRAVVAMAKSMHLRVVAEGVETAAQVAFLRAHGCDDAQGFYFSRPLPAGELAVLLREDRHRFARGSAWERLTR